MNNSDPALSPAEEKLTAWLDGAMPPVEAAAFERENPHLATERAALEKTRALLREHSAAPRLANPDFFNHQVLREISPPQAAQPARKLPAWRLWRLAFTGACCALAAAGIYKVSVAPDTLPARYYAEVLSVRAGDHKLTARVIHEEGISVVWVDGFDQLPADYVLE